MDDHRSVDVKGRTIVPNDFTFALSEQDHATFAEIHEALVRELCDAAREYARDEGYTFMGPVQVELTVDQELRPGRFTVVSRMHEGQGGVGRRHARAARRRAHPARRRSRCSSAACRTARSPWPTPT